MSILKEQEVKIDGICPLSVCKLFFYLRPASEGNSHKR
jgi:hypothetical protein